MPETIPADQQPVIAAKRGWQTLAQGLGVDVLVALALVITTVVVPGMETWQDVMTQWPLWLLVALRSVLQAVAAWAIRRWADNSGVEPRRALTEEA